MVYLTIGTEFSPRYGKRGMTYGKSAAYRCVAAARTLTFAKTRRRIHRFLYGASPRLPPDRIQRRRRRADPFRSGGGRRGIQVAAQSGADAAGTPGMGRRPRLFRTVEGG